MKVFIAHKNKSLRERFLSHINATGMADVTTEDVFEKITGGGGCEEVIENSQPYILFLGIRFEGNNDGLTFCRKMKGQYPQMRIVMIIAYEDFADYQEEVNAKGMSNGFISEDANEQVLKSAMDKLTNGDFFQYDTYTANGEPLEDLTVDPNWHLLASNTNDLKTSDAEKIPHYLQLIKTLENNVLDIIQRKPNLYSGSVKRFINSVLFTRNYNDWMISRLLNLEKSVVTLERSKFVLMSKRLSSVLHLYNEAGTMTVSEQEKDCILMLAAGFSSIEVASVEGVALETFNKKRQKLINKFGGNIYEMINKCLENKIITYEEINVKREEYFFIRSKKN